MYSTIDESIISICQNEYPYFLCKSNVVGVGLGLKTINGLITSEKSIHVLVSQKLPCHYIDENNLIPPLYKGFKTDVIETGTFSLSSLTDKITPIMGGCSIGYKLSNSRGSYGALVSDGHLFHILSNNHVLANLNDTPLGTPILQPASIDGGNYPSDVIGYLSKFIPLKFSDENFTTYNYVDAALARITNCQIISPLIAYVGLPTGVTEPSLAMLVQGTGSTSGFFHGKVLTIGTTISVCSNKGELIYLNQAIFDHTNYNGDSGTIVLDIHNRAVGLLFASSPNASAMNILSDVLSNLNVSLITK